MLHVVLVEPEIAPNVGNVARTCAATGCRLHLVGPLGFRLDDRALRRAGVDYWPAVDWRRYTNWSEFLQAMSGHRLWLFTARVGNLIIGYSTRTKTVWSSAANLAVCRSRCCKNIPNVGCAYRCPAEKCAVSI
jgi:tRNA (cytidine(34)-2'-O)-methyltransferase